VNQEESEHNEVDGMKKAVDFTGKVMQQTYLVETHHHHHHFNRTDRQNAIIKYNKIRASNCP